MPQRSKTFTTYRFPEPVPPDSFFTEEGAGKKPTRPDQCQKCLRREHLLREQHQQLLELDGENRKLNEKLHAFIVLNQRYQHENVTLKSHLRQLSSRPTEPPLRSDVAQLSRQPEKESKPKHNAGIDHLERLRHEVHVYNQFVAAKQQEERNHSDYSSPQY